MLNRIIVAAALALGLSSAAHSQAARTVATCGAQSLRVGDSTNLFVDSTGVLCSTAGSGGGGGGATGSVTPAGTSGTSAQAVQGITGGVPVPVTGSFASSPVVGAQEQDLRSTQTLNAATLNAAVTVPVNGQGTLGFALNGLTASGATLTFEQSEDGGTTWTVVNEVNAGTGVATSTRTTDGQTRISTSGRTNIRFRVSSVGTGTITVAYSLSVREGLVALSTPLPPGTNPIGFFGAGQYNATLPTLATGAYGYLAVDSNGRLIQSPGASVTVSSGTVTANLGTLNGAATATNQASEITQLTSIATRAVTFSEATNASVAASANLLGTSRAVGSPAVYARFNAAVTSSQAGTLFIQGSNDSAFTVPVALASVAVTAGQFANASAPVIFPFNRAYLFNGTTAGTATLNTSYTAN